LAMTHNALGAICRYEDNFDRALTHWREAIRYAEAGNNLFEAGRIRLNVAISMSEAGRLADALEYAYAALRNFETFGDHAPEIQRTRELITKIELILNLEQLLKSQDIYRKSGNLQLLHDVQARLTWTYRYLQEWNGFKMAMEERLDVARRLDRPEFVVEALRDLSQALDPPLFSSLFEEGGHSDMLIFLIQALLDVESFLQNIHLPEESSPDLAEAYYRSSLMTFHLDGERAIRWARKATEIYHRCGLEEKEAHAIARMGRIHAELGKYQEALQNYNLALRIFRRIGSPVEKEIRQAIKVCRLWMRSKP